MPRSTVQNSVKAFPTLGLLNSTQLTAVSQVRKGNCETNRNITLVR